MLFKEVFDSFDERKLESHEEQLSKLLYPDFRVRVIACKVPPTHQMFEMHLEPTRALVERLFAGQSLGRTAIHLTFVFPERWLAPQQIPEFMQRLATCNDAKTAKIKMVDIITGSPVMLTDFMGFQMVVVDESGAKD